MKCPKCGNKKDKVIDSRVISGGETIRRRRECLACRYRYTTYESVAKIGFRVVKRDGKVEDFDRAKLKAGISKACKNCNVSPEDIDNMVDMIVTNLQTKYDGEVPSTAIGARVLDQLNKLDQVAFVRFASVYRRFSDISDYQTQLEDLIGKEI